MLGLAPERLQEPDHSQTTLCLPTVATDVSVVNNSNRLGLNSLNAQWGGSGDAKVKDNTTGGSATSGAVANSNSNTANVSITNGSGSGSWSMDPSSDTGSISNTGPQSDNHITSDTNVDVTC